MIRTLAVIGMAVGVAAADPVDDPAHEPYLQPHGAKGLWARADDYDVLAAHAAEPARAARYLALACAARSAALFDATLGSDECKRAREIAERLDLVDVRVDLACVRGNQQAWHLDVDGAVKTLTDAVAASSSLDLRAELGYPLRCVRFTLGGILLESGAYDRARAELVDAHDASEASHDRELAAWTDAWLCRLDARIGEYADARGHCERAHAYVDASHDSAVALSLLWIEGELESRTGHPGAAYARYEEAWPLAQERGGETLRPSILLELMSMSVALGRRDDLAAWQTQLALVGLPDAYQPDYAMIRAEVAPSDAAYQLAATSVVHGTSLAGLYGLARTRAAAGDRPGARAALEQAIARIDKDREALGPDQRASFFALHARAYRDLIALDDDAGHALELAEASRARRLLDTTRMAESPHEAEPVASAKQIQAALQPDEALIEYVVLPDRALAIVATHASIAVVPLPGAGDLAERVSLFRQLVAESVRDDDILAPARALHRDVLAPAIATLPAGVTTLVVSPDGPLDALPWDALATDTGFVGDRWNVTVVPSFAAIARAPHAAPPGAALVVGTAADAEVVRARLDGDVATLAGAAALAPALDRYAVVHFASHAAADLGMPLRSSLAIGNDARLRADAIYRLHVGADLVVLAACETAPGRITDGEGVMSLSRAFLHAGATSTIVTLWPVAGPAFTDVLYRELGAGRSTVEAATAAKRALHAAGAPPAAWAAYVVTAPPGADVRVHGRPDVPGSSPRWPLLGALGCAVVALAMFRWRAAFGMVIGSGVFVALGFVVGPTAPQAKLAVGPARDDRAVLATTRDARTLHWQVEAGVTYPTGVFDADGRALAISNADGTLSVPDRAVWAIVYAERDGVTVQTPALVRF